MDEKWSEGRQKSFSATLALLGLASDSSAEKSKVILLSSADKTLVSMLIDARNSARNAKNFAEADRIRDELLAMGIVLKDSKDGTTWEVKR